jgi:hypothetical protein
MCVCIDKHRFHVYVPDDQLRSRRRSYRTKTQFCCGAEFGITKCALRFSSIQGSFRMRSILYLVSKLTFPANPLLILAYLMNLIWEELWLRKYRGASGQRLISEI